MITNNTKALIALRNANTNGYVVWGPDGMVDGAVATSPNYSNQIPEEALTDYDGVNNTLKEVLRLNPGQDCALYLASHYEFPNGSKGYLPALGELTEMFENIESVNSLLKKVEGEEFENYLYWSSSQHYLSYRAWSYDATGSSHKSFAQLRNEKSPLADIYGPCRINVRPFGVIPQTINIDDEYTLTYILDNQVFKTFHITYGTRIVVESPPTNEGYTFSGWSEIPETMPDHDVTVTGSFTVNQYTITYMVDGSVYKTTELDYGSVITPEAEPSKDGYSFSGWSEIPETMPAHDVTITASFSKGKKCAKPTVIYEGGKLLFSCSTPGAKCVSTITDNDITTNIGNERALTATYRIRFYAMAQGYEDSEPSVVTLCWLDYVPTTVGLEEVEMNEVKAMPILIETHDNTLLLNGIKPDTPIRVYDLSGRLMGKGSAMSGSTQIHTQLKAGQIAVIHIGEQSVKVKVQ